MKTLQLDPTISECSLEQFVWNKRGALTRQRNTQSIVVSDLPAGEYIVIKAVKTTNTGRVERQLTGRLPKQIKDNSWRQVFYLQDDDDEEDKIAFRRFCDRRQKGEYSLVFYFRGRILAQREFSVVSPTQKQQNAAGQSHVSTDGLQQGKQAHNPSNNRQGKQRQNPSNDRQGEQRQSTVNKQGQEAHMLASVDWLDTSQQDDSEAETTQELTDNTENATQGHNQHQEQGSQKAVGPLHEDTTQSSEGFAKEMAETGEGISKDEPEGNAETGQQLHQDTTQTSEGFAKEMAEAGEEISKDEAGDSRDAVEELREEIAQTAEGFAKDLVEEAVEELRKDIAQTAEGFAKEMVEDAVEELREDSAQTAEGVAKEMVEDAVEELHEDTAQTSEGVAKEMVEDAVEELHEDTAQTAEGVAKEMVEIGQRISCKHEPGQRSLNENEPGECNKQHVQVQEEKEKQKEKALRGSLCRSTWVEDGKGDVLHCGEAWQGGDMYLSKSGRLYDARQPPPRPCFRCRGPHWRRDCPLEPNGRQGRPGLHNPPGARDQPFGHSQQSSQSVEIDQSPSARHLEEKSGAAAAGPVESEAEEPDRVGHSDAVDVAGRNFAQGLLTASWNFFFFPNADSSNQQS